VLKRSLLRIACVSLAALALVYVQAAVAQSASAPTGDLPKPGAWRFAYRGITEGATTDTAENKPANYRPALKFGPEARKEFTVKRQEVFEFTQRPKLSRAENGITIDFESKGSCDATVAIEDKDGRIIRHLASGLLGPNAPEPFQRNSLKQHLIWDGKDDWGAAVENLEGCSVQPALPSQEETGTRQPGDGRSGRRLSLPE